MYIRIIHGKNDALRVYDTNIKNINRDNGFRLKFYDFVGQTASRRRKNKK